MVIGLASDIRCLLLKRGNASMRARRPALRTLSRLPPETAFECPRNSSGIPVAGCSGPSGRQLAGGAKPAQAVFAAVAAGHRRGEPVTVGVSAAQFQNARARLPPRGAASSRCQQQRRLDARLRADFRRRRAGAGGAGSTGPSMPGEASPEACTFPGTATTRSRRRCSRSKGTIATARPSCSKAAPSTSTVRAPASRPRSACSIRTAIRVSTRADIEDMLRRYLGVSTVIWLGRRCLPGRDRRPYRRARLLHEPRSRRPDLDRRPQRPAIRDLAWMPASA